MIAYHSPFFNSNSVLQSSSIHYNHCIIFILIFHPSLALKPIPIPISTSSLLSRMAGMQTKHHDDVKVIEAGEDVEVNVEKVKVEQPLQNNNHGINNAVDIEFVYALCLYVATLSPSPSPSPPPSLLCRF